MQADMEICCRAQNGQAACCQQPVLTSVMESLLSTEKMGGWGLGGDRTRMLFEREDKEGDN